MAARPCADDRRARLAAFEERHRRDREHLVPRCDLGVLVDVELRERDAAGRALGELVEERLDRVAGPAPRRPEVDDDRSGGDRLVERARVELLHQSLPVSAARRSTGTLATASRKIARLILEWPAVRSAKVIGTSTTVKPARSARASPSS